MMKVVQVKPEDVIDDVVRSVERSNFYRLLACDDGGYGKHHIAVRLKAVKRISVEELVESANDQNVAFIQVFPEEDM